MSVSFHIEDRQSGNLKLRLFDPEIYFFFILIVT